MAIPQVFHTVKPQDFTVTPVTVHKKYVIQRTDLYSGSLPITSSGYKIWEAIFTNEKLKLGTGKTYPTNSWDGSNKHIIWKSIDAQYYRYPYDSFATFEHANERFSYKFLSYSASIFSIPQQDFGEGIQPGTVILRNDDYNISLQDDGNGNLYDTSISTSSIASKENLSMYLSFNSLFRSFDNFYYASDLGLNSTLIGSGEVSYKSSTISPAIAIYKNCKFFDNPSANSGLTARFSGTSSYVMIDHVDDFNFASGDFSLAFWLYNSLSSSQTIMNKSEVLYKHEVDNFYSSSVLNEPTPVYPYKFHYDLASTKLLFYRSDGIYTTVASMSYTPESAYHHIAMVKTGSVLNLYKDGSLQCTIADTTTKPYNRHNIMIGGKNLTSNFDVNDIIGLSEIRFYNKGLLLSEVQALSNLDTVLQSAAMGNVFYKTGKIVLSTLNQIWTQKYYLMFDPTSTWSVQFRNTHTIYQWETIVRIPKGSFNLSQNPSALQNPYTDLLRNEFTGSNPNVDLYPYATTIGLYNDKKDLLAVAKLNQPLKMRDDVDMNISIKWDS